MQFNGLDRMALPRPQTPRHQEQAAAKADAEQRQQGGHE
jgi:hypothetical protein